MTLFVCGDVMTGRGIDQILPFPGDPRIFEPALGDARDYVRLAEQKNGPVLWPLSFEQVWGDALAVLAAVQPDVRIVNLETAVTARGRPWPKGINYRMHPANIAVLSVAGIDCCCLANNHVLDWGREGLTDTLSVLAAAGIRVAGAGIDLPAARAPAAIPVADKGRVLVFAFGALSSGIADAWAATDSTPGIQLLPDLSERTVDAIATRIAKVKRPGDLAVASIHWGGNWGYRIAPAQRGFAHALIERAQVDLVHGHSSHHPLGIEVFRERLIIYGCGDFLNDYEGIRGYDAFRPDLALMYFPTLDIASGRLLDLTLVPTQVRNMRIRLANRRDTNWLAQVIDRESAAYGSRVHQGSDGQLQLRWSPA